VLYVTERCVFSLSAEGMELIEIAPGVDLEKDILARMDFKPVMRQRPRLMDARIFRPEPMGLRCQVPDDYKVYDETTQGAGHAIVASHGSVVLH